MFYESEKKEKERIDALNNFISKEFNPMYFQEVVIKNNDKKVKRLESCMTHFEIDLTRNDLMINSKTSINDTYYR